VSRLAKSAAVVRMLAPPLSCFAKEACVCCSRKARFTSLKASLASRSWSSVHASEPKDGIWICVMVSMLRRARGGGGTRERKGKGEM
jgi:hypothetical protein